MTEAGRIHKSVNLLRERLMSRLLTGGPAAEWAASRHAREIQSDPAHSALIQQVQERMELPALPESQTVSGSIWGISVVRNEADIIAPVIEHLFSQGLDAVIIADNQSTDDTPLLLAESARHHPVHVAVDAETGHYQAFKMTLLSACARRAGADWIVPFDADEFWFAPQKSLGHFLRNSKAKRLRVEMYNLYPVPGIRFRQGPWRLEEHPCQFTKVAFRSHKNAMLADGNHDVSRPGTWSAGPKIVHVPWRSEQQFRRKTLDGSAALARTTLDEQVGWHWRNLGSLDEEAARRVWEQIVHGQAVDNIAWSPGAPSRLVDPFRWDSWDPEGILGQRPDGTRSRSR